MYYLKTLKRKNSRHYDKIVFQTEDQKEMTNYLTDNGFKSFSSHYVFTHILTDNNHIITQTHTASGLICSPTELFNQLTK